MTVLFLALLILTLGNHVSSVRAQVVPVTTKYGWPDGAEASYGFVEPSLDNHHKASYDPASCSMYAYAVAPFWGKHWTRAGLVFQHKLHSDSGQVTVKARVHFMWTTASFGIASKVRASFYMYMLGSYNELNLDSIPSIVIPIPILDVIMSMIEGGRAMWELWKYLQEKGQDPRSWPYVDLYIEIPDTVRTGFKKGNIVPMTISITAHAVAGLSMCATEIVALIEDAYVTEQVELNTFITGTDPENTESDVPVDSEVRVWFNRKVDTASVEKAFQITPKVVGAFSWDQWDPPAHTRMTFKPSAKLSFKTTYKATIDKTAKDIDGLPLINTPYSWEFTTAPIRPPSAVTPTTVQVGVKTTFVVEAPVARYCGLTMWEPGVPPDGGHIGPLTMQPIIGTDKWQATDTLNKIGDWHMQAIAWYVDGTSQKGPVTKVTVTPAPDFSMGASPHLLLLIKGQRGTATLTLQSINNFEGTVSLIRYSVPGYPQQLSLTSQVSPTSVTLTKGGTASATYSVMINPASADIGTSKERIEAVYGSVSHYVDITIEAYISTVLRNRDFEEWLEVPLVPRYWTLQTGTVHMSRTAHSGRYSVKLGGATDTEKGWNERVELFQIVKPAYQKLSLSFWALGANPWGSFGARVEVLWFDVDRIQVGSSSIPIQESSSWKYYESTVTSPPTAVYWKIQIVKASWGYILIDDMQLAGGPPI